MTEFIQEFLLNHGINERISLYLTNIIMVLFILLVSSILVLIVKKVVLRLLLKIVARSKTNWDDLLLKNKVLDPVTYMVPAFIIHTFAPTFPAYEVWIERISYSYIVFMFLIAIDRFLDTVDDIYRGYKMSKVRPIKGYLQVLKIIIYTVGIIAMIGILLDRSPWVLLGSIGAASAVLLLVFQNSILGFVAGIQLTSNNMVQLGDWIEMQKYGADGDVIEISLHTVKVQNWDKTITTIPTQSMVTDSFKNWKGMHQSGGRRIKRAIYIDMTSVKFCDEDMLTRFSKIQYLDNYLEDKKKEIEEYNKSLGYDVTNMVNGRHLTNLGTFRAYVQNYLKSHSRVNQNMIQLVRQLEPTERGLPLEIYVFTNGTAWANYEGIQADIFDHILAVIPEFGLRIFQSPSGYDISGIQNKM